MGSTSMLVARVNAVPKAPMEVSKQIAPEEINPGTRAGIRTSRITRQGEAPSERAASSRLRSSFSADAMMVVIVRGIEKYRYPRKSPLME